MVVELTEQELFIIGESVNLYLLTLIQTREAYNNVKNDTNKEKEKIQLQSEINIASEVIEGTYNLLKKLNLEDHDIHQI